MYYSGQSKVYCSKTKPPDFSEFTKSKDYSYYARCSRRVGKGGSAHQKLLEIQVDKGNTI